MKNLRLINQKALKISIEFLVLTLIQLSMLSCDNLGKSPKADVFYVYESVLDDKSLNNFNFSSRRRYLNDSVFEDLAVLCQSDTITCGLRFYISNGDWYFWDGSKFSLFYDKSLNIIQNQSIIYSDQKLIATNQHGEARFSNAQQFSIFDNSDSSGQSNLYFFDPQYGVIGISSNMVTLVRNDYKELSSSY